MTQSILDNVKKVVGIAPTDTSYDIDVLMHTNSIFSTLTQLGVGPDTGFEIEDSTATWDTFLNGDKRMNFVKSYVYLCAKLIFDPPQNSFVTDSINKQIQQLEWRINVVREGDSWTDPDPQTTPDYTDCSW